jgi:hypothetical protein
MTTFLRAVLVVLVGILSGLCVAALLHFLTSL